MATIQIRNIPEPAYETIRRRARAEGRSIQSYMHDHVVEFAGSRTKAETLADIRAALATDPGPGATQQHVLDDLDEDRR